MPHVARGTTLIPVTLHWEASRPFTLGQMAALNKWLEQLKDWGEAAKAAGYHAEVEGGEDTPQFRTEWADNGRYCVAFTVMVEEPAAAMWLKLAFG